MSDAGVAIQCPGGYTLDQDSVQVTWNGHESAVGCWQATLGSDPVLDVEGLPDVNLGPTQLTVKFNATDGADGGTCPFSTGATIALTSGCVTVEGSNVAQWYTFSTEPSGSTSPTGSLTINQWPAESGQPVSVTFSSDATLVERQQSSPTTVSIAGSFQTNAQ